MSAEPDSEYFGDGIAEEIINALACSRAARRRAHLGFAVQGKAEDLRAIGARSSACARCSRAASAARATGCGSPPSWWTWTTATTSGRSATTAS